jgi:predicted house-cleaning noncanonical NTP pyrophosphatase (MazG superfamily)
VKDTVGKLVRDKIPDIIRASGRTPCVSTLTPSAYRTALHDKLNEEVRELGAAPTRDAVVEETADIVEVLIAIAGDWGVTLESVLDAARRKRAERGGFSRRLWLDGVDLDSASP